MYSMSNGFYVIHGGFLGIEIEKIQKCPSPPLRLEVCGKVPCTYYSLHKHWLNFFSFYRKRIRSIYKAFLLSNQGKIVFFKLKANKHIIDFYNVEVTVTVK